MVTPARALEVPKQPLGRVSDYAHALTDEQRQKLDAQLRGYETGTRQIAVAIWKSIEDQSVEDFSNRVLIQWGLGGKKENDGVLLAVFLDEHKIRIDNGYGVEDRLTDARSAQIIRNTISPKFKQGDIYGGLSEGVAEIDRVLQGQEPRKAPARHDTDGSDIPWGILLFIGFLIVMMILNRKGFSGGPWWWGGGGGGWTGGGGGWSGGGWGGGGGGWGGGGGGGFSGGGGSGGGGGATGGW